MYSFEERIKAVMLYIQYDFKATVAIRELGYPSERMLRYWYNEYEISHVLHKEHRKKPNKYPKEKRQEAVEYYFSHGKCLASTVRQLGYPHVDTLKSWINEIYPGHFKNRIKTGRVGTFSEGQKRTAVIALCSRECSADTIANEIGVSRQQLYEWKNALLGKEVPANMKNNVKNEENISHGEDESLKKELSKLRKEIYQLQIEHDILKKANEILKKNQGINLQELTNREKTELIGALIQTYKSSELMSQLEIPRSSFYYQKSRINVPDKYKNLRVQIKQLFEANKKCYGYRRIHSCLKRLEAKVSEKVVRRIMKEEGLRARTHRHRRYNSYMGEITPAVKNKIKRNFHADNPNEKWLTDITEFQIPAGKMYLSPIIDCFDGMVVSWTIGTKPDANLVNTMLDAAITGLNNNEAPIVHSDRGCHYRWPGWISRMKGAGLTRSMSKKGYSPDNAACEGFFGRVKNEMYYNENWANTGITEFINHLDEYIRWYNEKRIKNNLGGLSPVEYRQKLSNNVQENIRTPFFLQFSTGAHTIETSKSGDNIEYSVYDNNDSVKIEMVFNTVTKKLNYNQTIILHFAENAIQQGSSEETQVAFVEFNDATVNTNLSFQSDYTWTIYRKYTDGNCWILGSQNIEFYSSGTVNGFAYSNFKAPQAHVEDIRPTDEIPNISNSAAIKTACVAVLDPLAPVYTGCLGMWYENGVIAVTAQADVASLSASIPWTSELTDIAQP